MVIRSDIEKLGRRSRNLIRCISRIGHIGTHRRQSITLIQICEELERHLELKSREGTYDERIASIIHTAGDILNAIAGPRPSGYDIGRNINDCVGLVEAYVRGSHLTCLEDECALRKCDYQNRMQRAREEDDTRASWVAEWLKKVPKKPASETKKPINLMFHSLWEQATLLPCQLEQSTSLPQLIYMLSKGLKLGRQINLSQNPRVYHGFLHPYDQVTCFKMERAGADSVPRKSPEVNLEKFKLEGDGECEMIHVYFDQHPLVILEDTSNKPAFSLAGWGQKFPPATGMIRGQNGVLYDTASLPNLIPHNHTDDRAPTEGAAIGLLAKISAAYESASELRRDPLKGSRTEISYHWTESQSGISRVRVEAPVNSAPPATAGRVEPVEESTFQGSIPETVADPGDDSDDAGGDAGSDAGIEWFDALDKLPANKSSNPKEITRGSEPHEPPIENQEPHTEPIAVEAGQSDDSTADRSREQEAPVDAESPPDIIPDLIDTIQEQLADATSNSLLETQIASQTSNPPPIVQLPAPKKKKAWFRRWL